MQDNDIQALVAYCKSNLDLASLDISEEYHYQSLPLCVIDAVYSINSNYTSTQNVVSRFCTGLGLHKICEIHPPPIVDQLSITDFIRFQNQHGVTEMATAIYRNRQRTSTRNGILKAEAVLRFSQALQNFEVEYFQDVHEVLANAAFESAIQKIPGQSSGISLRYFYMLAGSSDYIKPDRMVFRFIESAIHRVPSIEECHTALVEVSRILGDEHARLSPRTLDNLIWKQQRAQ